MYSANTKFKEFRNIVVFIKYIFKGYLSNFRKCGFIGYHWKACNSF